MTRRIRPGDLAAVAAAPRHCTISLHVGDVREVLGQFENNSHHGCLTDSPYGLGPIGSRSTRGINGESWDNDVPSTEVFRELNRICVPGGLLLSFGHSRTFHRLATNIEHAGFDIHGHVTSIFNQGFMKAHDLAHRTAP